MDPICRWGTLFFERNHHVYLLHKSLADWLLKSSSALELNSEAGLLLKSVNVASGHDEIAALLSAAGPEAGYGGHYGVRYLVRHLCSGTSEDALDAALAGGFVPYLELAFREVIASIEISQDETKSGQEAKFFIRFAGGWLCRCR